MIHFPKCNICIIKNDYFVVVDLVIQFLVIYFGFVGSSSL